MSIKGIEQAVLACCQQAGKTEADVVAVTARLRPADKHPNGNPDHQPTGKPQWFVTVAFKGDMLN